MSDEDERLVEAVGRAMAKRDREFHWNPNESRKAGHQREAKMLLDFLRAEGCEVVRWRRVKDAPKDGTYVVGLMASGHKAFMQFCAEGYWRTRVDDVASAWEPTHFAILRGPEVKP